MSEHYDFHYQPTGSGAISGQQVLQQTEDAINELGDYVNDNVGGAMDVAQQALETAQNAEQDAQTALDTANSFSDAIQSAQQDASTALSTAQTAQTTASNASNTANQASQDANTAVTTANNASGQVSTLSGTVTALGQRVTTAEGNIGQNTSDITALTTRVGTAEGNITTLQNDVTIAQGNASSAMATAGQVKQQAFVFRYSSTALVASSTNSNTLLDNTDNLKVGDKVIDSNGVLFSVTAIDTVNSTFTVGSALIDLALDANVVHTSGDETIGGVKRFTNDIIRGSVYTNSTIQARNLIGNTTASTAGSDSSSYQSITATLNYSDSTPSKSVTVSLYVTENAYSDGKYSSFRPSSNNSTNLGAREKKWANVYATNYYYGANAVEFSDKFVTTDTDQTVDGKKQLNAYLTLNGSQMNNEFSNNARTCAYLTANRDTVGKSGVFVSKFRQNRAQGDLQSLDLQKIGFDVLENEVRTNNVFDIQCTDWLNDVPQRVNFVSSVTSYSWGHSSKKSLINGLEPSSLSLPSGNASDVIDISSYLTVLDGSSVNTYIAPANGWISITMSNSSGIQAYINGLWGHQVARPSLGAIRFLMPVLKNQTVNISILGGTIEYARFIPCQGNV